MRLEAFWSASRPRLRWGTGALAALLLLSAGWVSWVWWSADGALDRRSLHRIEQRRSSGPSQAASELDGVINALLVGSDSREGLSAEQRRRLHTGQFNGKRTDTILLVQARPDGVSLLSFPRDLRVEIPGHGMGKINGALELGGPDALVGAIEDLVEVDLDHYIEIAIPSFLEIVDAAGGVRLCLDSPLTDQKAGADFDAGCHHMDGAEALSYVRSRAGKRADFDRVERQQRFLAALAHEVSSLSLLANPVRLQTLANTVADGLTVDDGLDVPRMVELSLALDDVLDRGLETFTLPAYPDRMDGVAYVVPYRPAVTEIGRRLRSGQTLPQRLDETVRADTRVLLWASGSPRTAARLESVLFFAGWRPVVSDSEPSDLPGSGTTVFANGEGRLSDAVANTLGAPIRELPPDIHLRDGVEVAVRVESTD